MLIDGDIHITKTDLKSAEPSVSAEDVQAGQISAAETQKALWSGEDEALPVEGVVELIDEAAAETPDLETGGSGSGDIPPADAHLSASGEGDEERDAHIAKVIAKADLLLDALALGEELEGSNPRFRDIGSDVIIFYDKPGNIESNDGAAVRTAFSVKDRSQEVPVDELNPNSPWLEGAGREPPLDHGAVIVAFDFLERNDWAYEDPPEDDDEIPSEPRAVQATRLGSADEAGSLAVEIVQSDAMVTSNAAGEEKSLVKVIMEGSSAAVPMIERGCTSEYVKAWAAFTAAEISVPPEAYVTADQKILVTDIKADGSETYGKALYVGFREHIERVYPHREIDPLFVELMKENGDAVRERAQLYAERANAHGIRLDFIDPFEVIVHPNGEWDVIALDLAEARIGQHDDVLLAHRNYVVLTEFFNMLDTIADNLEARM